MKSVLFLKQHLFPYLINIYIKFHRNWVRFTWYEMSNLRFLLIYIIESLLFFSMHLVAYLCLYKISWQSGEININKKVISDYYGFSWSNIYYSFLYTYFHIYLMLIRNFIGIWWDLHNIKKVIWDFCSSRWSN